MWCAGERASAMTVSATSRASVLRGGQAAARTRYAQARFSVVLLSVGIEPSRCRPPLDYGLVLPKHIRILHSQQ